MISLDDEVAREYLAECGEHLAAAEAGLLAMEKDEAAAGPEVVNRVFRAVHSVKGGAGFFDLVKIGQLAHKAEDVLALIRSRDVAPTPDRIRVLLGAVDRLRELIRDPAGSNQAGIDGILEALAQLQEEPQVPAVKGSAPAFDPALLAGRPRFLLAEDDFASRLLLQTFLSRYGECHVAVNGREAVETVRAAMVQGQRYDLICMDIMMPEMDGREAVRQVRALEMEFGILSTFGAKIVMVTTVTDVKEVIRCFRELCDCYLMKPIDLADLHGQMKLYGLVQ
jgi:two-component system, chemotaxis family, chemotaxis protein CheY